jgi:hypothetical protein
VKILRTSGLLLAFAAALCAFEARAVKTVCTITVNSSDEREAFRRYLPREQYQFVELVEKGRPDWLRSSCQRGVQCDVLVVSGHFNAGETFYSDKIENNDFFKVDELERASCSNSCPGLFSRLKEVYLFGCESLNPDATKYSSSYGESGRERMRRVFANVPVIYGFSGAAPVGPTAAAILGRYFSNGSGGEIGNGRASSRMLGQFSMNRMVAVSGMRDSDPGATHRRDVCQFYDERQSAEQKLDFVHALLRRDTSQLRVLFDRIEKLLASLPDIDRQAPSFSRALASITYDREARERYLAFARDAAPDVRSRMLQVAATFHWLTPVELRAEQMRLASDLLASNAASFAEVELMCSLNAGGELTLELPHSPLASLRPARTAHAAILACLGSPGGRAQVMRALGSSDDKDVQIAQVYLRHHPLSPAELREVAAGISRMTDSRAQIRALDTLGRHSISDREILEELARSFAQARSVGVQRAIAEVFIRSDQRAIARSQLASLLRQHRLKSPDGREDLIDTLIRRLSS